MISDPFLILSFMYTFSCQAIGENVENIASVILENIDIYNYTHTYNYKKDILTTLLLLFSLKGT